MSHDLRQSVDNFVHKFILNISNYESKEVIFYGVPFGRSEVS